MNVLNLIRKAIPTALVGFLGLVVMVSCSDRGKQAPVSAPDKQIKATDYSPGTGYELAWSDEFEGAQLDSNNWNRQIVEAGRFNEEWQRYSADKSNAYLEGGALVLKAMHESDEHDINQYTSARLNTAGKQSWTYGKIAARMKLPQGQGIWPAFWMLGTNINENGGDTPWPQCGEIDILELYGSKNDAVVEANLHYADAANKHAMMGAAEYQLSAGIFADDYHIFELEWTAEQIIWRVNGNKYASMAITSAEFSEFHAPFFLLLNIAVGGTWAGYPNAASSFPQHMYVDWVRVYQQKA